MGLTLQITHGLKGPNGWNGGGTAVWFPMGKGHRSGEDSFLGLQSMSSLSAKERTWDKVARDAHMLMSLSALSLQGMMKR